MKRQLCLITVILSFAGCSSLQKGEALNIVDILAYPASDTTQFIMDDILKGEDYDSFLFLPPYTNPENTERVVGVNLKSVEDSEIEFRDDVYLLCLLKGREVAAWHYLSRKSVDFEGVSNLQKEERTQVLRLINKASVYQVVD